MFRLFTIYWPETNADRRAELDFALKVNLSAFDEVTILAERSPRPDWFRGTWFDGEQRQQFRDLIALAAHAEPRDIVVLANSDILFTRDALRTIGHNLERNEAYCLTRWDMWRQGGLHLFDTPSSQDAWIFRGPPKVDGGDFRIGDPGSDNRAAQEIEAAGYRVLNPSKSIQAVHYHLVDRRTANIPANRVPLPYLLLKPHALGEEPEYSRPTRLPKRAGFHRV